MVTNNGKIKKCEQECSDCIFTETYGCIGLRELWLVSPYEPPEKKPVITDIVKKFLEICDPENYIFRAVNGHLYMCTHKAKKLSTLWEGGGSHMQISKLISEDLYQGFDFIKWEDDEPWKIADLLQIAAEQ